MVGKILFFLFAIAVHVGSLQASSISARLNPTTEPANWTTYLNTTSKALSHEELATAGSAKVDGATLDLEYWVKRVEVAQDLKDRGVITQIELDQIISNKMLAEITYFRALYDEFIAGAESDYWNLQAESASTGVVDANALKLAATTIWSGRCRKRSIELVHYEETLILESSIYNQYLEMNEEVPGVIPAFTLLDQQHKVEKARLNIESYRILEGQCEGVPFVSSVSSAFKPKK